MSATRKIAIWYGKMHPADKGWLLLILTIWTMLLGSASWPSSYWFDVRRIHIADSVVGKSPWMEIDRTIRRPFQARWIVTVMRQELRGFATFCTARGRNDYDPEAQLPDELTLDWWTSGSRCTLPAGTYFVRTVWTIDPPLLPKKEVRIASNVFNIRKP